MRSVSETTATGLRHHSYDDHAMNTMFSALATVRATQDYRNDVIGHD
jgi:hypothetical protein